MPIQLSLPGVQTPEQAEIADLEDAFARTTIELCELRAEHAEALECLIEAIEEFDRMVEAGVAHKPHNYDRWIKITEIK